VGNWASGSFTHVVGDAHVDQLVLAGVVDQVVAVCVGHLVVVHPDPADDVLRHFGEVADAVRVLGQHGGAPRYYTIKYRHGATDSSLMRVRFFSSSSRFRFVLLINQSGNKQRTVTDDVPSESVNPKGINLITNTI